MLTSILFTVVHSIVRLYFTVVQFKTVGVYDWMQRCICSNADGWSDGVAMIVYGRIECRIPRDGVCTVVPGSDVMEYACEKNSRSHF